MLVCCNGHTDTRSAYEYAALKLTRLDPLTKRSRIIGIVAGIGGIRAYVLGFNSSFVEVRNYFFFSVKTAVVTSDNYLIHVYYLTVFQLRASPVFHALPERV